MRYKAKADAAWESLERSIGERRWPDIKEAWIRGGIPLIEPPGSAPSVSFTDFVDIQNPVDLETTPLLVNRGEVVDIVFREGVYWLHKSLHVLAASELHISAGMQTWSLAAGYQSGVFAIRSLMAFLGITVCDHQRTSVFADICRDVQGFRPQKVAALGAFLDDIPLLSLGMLFGHAHMWRLFQRLLVVSRGLPWPSEWSAFFQNLEAREFTEQRHRLHYHLKYWVMADLHEALVPGAFADVEFDGDGKNLFERSRNNFSLAAGFTLNRMALRLFRSLAASTNRLAQEAALFDTGSFADRHPFFATDLALADAYA